MNPIEARIVDFDGYLRWMNDAGPYLDFLMESRDHSMALIPHPDSVARLAAIESFTFLWHFDDQIADLFLLLATQDSNNAVRYTATGSLMLMHLRCKHSSDRAKLEMMLGIIVRSSYHIRELVIDVEEYLKIMGTSTLSESEED